MTKIKDTTDKLRALVKEFLNSDSPKEVIDKVTAIDSVIDEVEKVTSSTQNELNEIKTDYINFIKQTGFKVAPEPKPGDAPAKAKTFEEIAAEVAAKGD